MRVVHVSTKDIEGGASRSAHRLHIGLRDVGVDTLTFVRNKKSNLDSVVQLRPDESLSGRLRRGARYLRLRSEFFPWYTDRPRSTGALSDDRSRFDVDVLEQLPTADILHLHWIAGFVDIPAFFKQVNQPIVWTLHDMNPFTGGCHYSFGCRRFEQSCGCCPLLDSTRERDPSRRSWKRKRKAFQNRIRAGKLQVVSPSSWLADEAKRSTLLDDAPVHHIPYGLDCSLFRPQETSGERSELGISKGRPVILFVAHSSTESRKGFGLLTDALSNADLDGVTLVSVGRNRPEVTGRFSHVHVGYVSDDQRMAKLYSLASLFVIPSLQDNLPNTVLESMACGTPVVGFDTGGIPDMVRPNVTGWLAEKGNARSLRNAIELALENDSERERLGKRCREVVEEEYTLERQAERYADLYETILE